MRCRRGLTMWEHDFNRCLPGLQQLLCACKWDIAWQAALLQHDQATPVSAACMWGGVTQGCVQVHSLQPWPAPAPAAASPTAMQSREQRQASPCGEGWLMSCWACSASSTGVSVMVWRWVSADSGPSAWSWKSGCSDMDTSRGSPEAAGGVAAGPAGWLAGCDGRDELEAEGMGRGWPLTPGCPWERCWDALGCCCCCCCCEACWDAAAPAGL